MEETLLSTWTTIYVQDMEMVPRYMTEFEFNGQQHEEYEYTPLEDPFDSASQHPQVFNKPKTYGQVSQYGELMPHKVNLSLKLFNIVSS
ncbi:unnamed protein product [Caenorhabditis brenneri]